MLPLAPDKLYYLFLLRCRRYVEYIEDIHMRDAFIAARSISRSFLWLFLLLRFGMRYILSQPHIAYECLHYKQQHAHFSAAADRIFMLLDIHTPASRISPHSRRSRCFTPFRLRRPPLLLPALVSLALLAFHFTFVAFLHIDLEDKMPIVEMSHLYAEAIYHAFGARYCRFCLIASIESENIEARPCRLRATILTDSH